MGYDNTAYVVKKQVYGRDVFYPDCEPSRTLCRMLGRKTLTPELMKEAGGLGFYFKLTPEELKL